MFYTVYFRDLKYIREVIFKIFHDNDKDQVRK